MPQENRVWKQHTCIPSRTEVHYTVVIYRSFLFIYQERWGGPFSACHAWAAINLVSVIRSGLSVIVYEILWTTTDTQGGPKARPLCFTATSLNTWTSWRDFWHTGLFKRQFVRGTHHFKNSTLTNCIVVQRKVVPRGEIDHSVSVIKNEKFVYWLISDLYLKDKNYEKSIVHSWQWF